MIPVDSSFIGKRITELRLARGISEYQMSLELGMSGSYIQGITSGKNVPSVRQFFNIADYFGVSMSEFFAENGDEQALSPTQLECIRAVRAMSEEDAQFLLGIIRRLVSAPHE